MKQAHDWPASVGMQATTVFVLWDCNFIVHIQSGSLVVIGVLLPVPGTVAIV